jgi:hypothetical protein
MKDCKFKQLILDVYKEWAKPERVFDKTEFGFKATYKNFWGTIYNAISRDTFDNVIDIDKYMEIANPDMLLLNSRATGQEVEIYQFYLKDYRIEGDKLIVSLQNRKEEVVFEM